MQYFLHIASAWCHRFLLGLFLSCYDDVFPVMSVAQVGEYAVVDLVTVELHLSLVDAASATYLGLLTRVFDGERR